MVPRITLDRIATSRKLPKVIVSTIDNDLKTPFLKNTYTPCHFIAENLHFPARLKRGGVWLYCSYIVDE
jgi:hypothetical protein